jgi:hypothetical protein
MSNQKNLEQIVEETLRELGQAGTREVLEGVKRLNPTASLHQVRKILKEGGFAKPGLAEITIARRDILYKKQSQVWVYTGQTLSGMTNASIHEGPSIEVRFLPRRQRTPYRVIEETNMRPLKLSNSKTFK